MSYVNFNKKYKIKKFYSLCDKIIVLHKGMNIMIIDTHCHLNFEDFDTDINFVLKRAIEQHISIMIIIGTDVSSNHKAIKMAQNNPHLYASVGIHPGSISDTENISAILPMITHPKVVAIGECGLDFYWKKDNKEVQIDLFIKHIELAVKFKKPLVIHTRESFLEAYEALKPYKGQVTGVFHCFSSDLNDAQKAIDLGFYIGIDGPITYKKNEVLKEIVQAIDLKHILVETDSPYLTPHPHRGKRNEPSYLPYIIDKIAEIKGITCDEVIQITSSNAQQLFKLKEEKL